MDVRHFDALVRVLSVSDSRRRLVAVLAALPVLGALSSILSLDAAAKDRRRRRKQRHKRRKSPGNRKHPGCKPKGMGVVCAGRCGLVKGRQTCGKTVDCGSCDCNPACTECFTCQGAPGVCVPQDAGTPCGGAETCASGMLQPRSQCDGSGTCVPSAPVSCAPYTQCDGNGCATSCASDGDCVASSYCEAGQCVGDLPNGQVCVQAGQCASGFCVENICCNSVCDGDCETCAIPGSLGTCTTEDNLTPCGGGNVCCGGTCQECCGNGQCSTTTPLCNNGVCVACSVNPAVCSGGTCCASDGSCQSGTTNSACGSSGTCEVCTGQAVCHEQTCCQPTTCLSLGKECGSWPDECGGVLQCGTCGTGATPACNNGTCDTCANTCGASCTTCDNLIDGSTLCADGGSVDCGATCTSDADCAEGRSCTTSWVNRATGTVTTMASSCFGRPAVCGYSAPCSGG